jgi:hypothetical protein
MCANKLFAEEKVPQVTEPASATLSKAAVFKLDNQSFTLGLAYAQVTYKTRHKDTVGNTQITDNGAPSLILELSSSEKILKEWTLKSSSAIVGWDVNAAASIFDTRYQLLNSAFRGKNIGTNVNGGYLGIAPTVFLKMGPVYQGKNLYWKIGYGIGPGLLKSSGNAYFSSAQGGVIYNVGSKSPAIAIYNTALWQLQADNWYFDILAKWLQAQDGRHTSLESYGFGVAYRFSW